MKKTTIILNNPISQEIDFSNNQEISESEINELEIELLKIRKEIDNILSIKDCGYKTEYPIGHCGEIRDAVFEKINILINSNENNIFKKLYERGLEFKKIYGIENGDFFQNSTQLGKYNVNVAGNTVDIKDKSIEITEMRESGMENFSTYERFCKIAEKYWGYKIIPNIYLAKLQNKIPLFFQREDGVFFLPDFLGIISENDSKNDFKLSKQFLENNIYKNNKLPEEYIKLINNSEYIQNLNIVPPINKELYKLYLRIKKRNKINN